MFANKNISMISISVFLIFGLVATGVRAENVANIKNEGKFGSKSFRIKYKGGKEGKSTISPWHDIPLKNGDRNYGYYNMVVEIPKMTRAKMEISTKEKNNPIAQDLTKKGTIRDYHGPIFWNYGCIPQTWEDPNLFHPELNVYGDNDPIDLVEIGSAAIPMGSVKEVKILGALAMIDDGELDWKVIVVAKDDPLAQEYHDIDDVPDMVKSGIREWFRWYKTPDNKPLNRFGFNERYINRQEAIDIIEETHVAWKKLKAGITKPDKLWVGEIIESFATEL